MEDEAGSGWTGLPAHVSDDADGGNEANRESGPSAGGSAEMADDPALAPVRELPTPATGEPRVDAALRLLERLPGLPVAEHPQLFEQVHAQLSEVLGELDPGSGPVGR